MAAPQIDVVFDPPLPGDSGSVFDTKAFSFIEDLNPWAVDANALATYVNARALEAEAAVLTGDVTPNVANALDLVRLNAAGTGLEYVDLVALKASTANAEAGTGTGLMDPVLTKAAIDAQELQIGVGQTRSSPTRTSGTTYQNTTGKPISVNIVIRAGGTAEVSPDASTWTVVGRGAENALDQTNTHIIVQQSEYYRATGNILNWVELR